MKTLNDKGRCDLPSRRLTFTFDATGQRTAMQDSTGTTTYTYDNAGRPISVISPGPKAITYTYDNAGSRATMQDPDGGLWTYTHDASNRLTKLLNPFTETTTLEYDSLNRPTILRHANGTRAEHTYDAGSRLTQLSNLKSDNTTISSFGYSLDNAGNRTGVVEANGDRVTWTYDETYQLTREQRSGANGCDITYVYDPTGNRSRKIDAATTTTYTYDAGNRLQTETTPTAVTTYTFDNNGNTTVKNAAGQLTTYVWDGENRMTGIQYPNGALNTLSYNGDGQRREKIDSAGTTRFVWDGQKVLLETDQSGNTTAVYGLSDGMYGDLLSQRRSGASRFYHFDGLGSTNRLSDGAQAQTDSYLYDAWGNVVSSSGTTQNPHKYVGALGYYADPDSGLMLLRARYYESRGGRFWSEDPLREGLNWHQYVHSNPVMLSDPSGYGTWHCWAWGALHPVTPGVICDKYASGTGSGPTENIACLAAKKAMNVKAGCQKGHVQCKCDENKMPSKPKVLPVPQPAPSPYKIPPITWPQDPPNIPPWWPVPVVLTICLLCPECCLVGAPVVLAR